MYKNQCVNSLLERSDLRIHKINAFLKVSLFGFHGLGGFMHNAYKQYCSPVIPQKYSFCISHANKVTTLFPNFPALCSPFL